MKKCLHFALLYLVFVNYSLGQKIDSIYSEPAEKTRIGYLWVAKQKNVGLTVSDEVEPKETYFNPLLSLQGEIPGFIVSRVDGQEGNKTFSYQRGISSFFLSSQPLIVLNGYPIHDYDISSSTSNIGYGNRISLDPLRFLNQKDIKSIHFLRDIASTAIYGSRGANGVLLIETTEPEVQRLTYSSSISLASVATEYDLLNRSDFLSAFDQLTSSAVNVDFGNNVDWQDEILRTTLSSTHHLAFSKPLKNGYFDSSIGYERFNGVLARTTGENFTASLGGQFSFFDDRLSLGTSFLGSSLAEIMPAISSTAGARGDLLSSALTANPTWSAHPDSTQIGGALVNPNNLKRYHQDETKTQRIVANINPSLLVLPTTRVGLKIGLDQSWSDRTLAVSRRANNLIRGVEGNGRAAVDDVDQQDLLLELAIEDHRKVGNSTIDMIVGYADQRFMRDVRNAEAWGIDADEPGEIINIVRPFVNLVEASIPGSFQQFGISELLNVSGTSNFFVNRIGPVRTDLSNFTTARPVNSIAVSYLSTETRIKSYFGRFLFNVADKYGVNLSSRVDNSNLYSDLSFFGSLGLAWSAHNEPFMGDWASKLILKVSYGTSGNMGANLASTLNFNGQELERFGNLTIGPGGDIVIPGISVQTENDDLRVERTNEINVTSEFEIENTGLSGEISWYRRISTDLISITNTATFTSGLENTDGEISNSGWELMLKHHFKRNDFGLRTQMVFSHNVNKIDRIEDGRDFSSGLLFGPGVTGTFVQRFEQSNPVFSYFLREFQGFDQDGFQQLGNFDLLDKSAIVASSLGLNLGVDYRDFSIDLAFYGYFGHYLYNNTANAFFSTGAIANARNVTSNVVNSGQSIFAETSPSTRYLERANFLRCRSIILNYAFDKQPFKLSELEIFGMVQNPFVITGYSGLDPEVNVQVGIDYLAYPMTRTYTLGIRASL